MMLPPPGFFPPPPREKSFARAIFMTLATTIFGLSLLLNIYLIAFAGILGGTNARHKTIVDGDATQVIAVVPISGMIDSKAYDQFDKVMRKLEQDKNVKALVIEIDSPGGTVTASDEIYHRIRSFKLDHGVPVVVSMRSLAASGGYYVACAGDWLFAEPTTLTGSIGVVLPKFNLSKLAEKWGIQDTSQHSTGADFKTAGSPLRPETAAETQYFQEVIDASVQDFKNVVADARLAKLTVPGGINEVASGKIFKGTTAVKMGLVDQIGFPADAWAYAKSAAGLKNPSVVRYEEPNSFLEMLGANSSFPAQSQSLAPGTTVNVNLNFDIEQLLRSSSRPMYLFSAGSN